MNSTLLSLCSNSPHILNCCNCPLKNANPIYLSGFLMGEVDEGPWEFQPGDIRGRLCILVGIGCTCLLLLVFSSPLGFKIPLSG